jgi:hypothetical protein
MIRLGDAFCDPGIDTTERTRDVQSAASGALVERMIGAAKLDAQTYEAVEHDTNAMTQAAVVVVLAAIAGAIGSLRDASAGGIVLGLLSAVISWVIFSAMAYFVGTRLVPSSETSANLGELLRTLGFAQTPSLLSVVGFIPVAGPLIAFVGAVWTLVANIVAIRQALEMSTGRAIVVAILSVIVLFLIVLVLAAILGVSIALA